MWLIVEPVRLYYGVCGNLKESVRDLIFDLLFYYGAIVIDYYDDDIF